MAILSMGMNRIAPFKPEEKIIEYQIDRDKEKLINMEISNFIDELSTDSPAPGGGSVAALNGSLSAALISMVANLTVGKKGYEKYFKDMGETAESAQKLKDDFLTLIDRDTDTFNKVMAAIKMPKKTDKEKKEREKTIEEATKSATRIPLNVMEATLKLIPLLENVTKKGNKNSISDAGVAALMGLSALKSAYLNVIINLKGINDEAFVKKTKKQAEKIKKDAEKALEKLYKDVINCLEEE